MSREDELRKILSDLRVYLGFQREMGVDGILSPKEGKTGEGETGSSKQRSPIAHCETRRERPKPPPSQPLLTDFAQPKKTLDEIRRELGECTRCRLSQNRTNIVFGEGNPEASIVFVGEGPGADEDAQGRPFVGKAGQLLNRVIKAMGFQREEVYICNVVKCRPPGNRTPAPDEIAACEPFLFAQLRSIEPKIIICLGSVAAHSVLKLQKKTSLASLRGEVFTHGNSKVVVTYHPAALLRNPALKKPLWEDVKMALAEIGLKPPRE
jgi:DNA polymerase